MTLDNPAVQNNNPAAKEREEQWGNGGKSEIDGCAN
jgi:hypothetical protein